MEMDKKMQSMILPNDIIDEQFEKIFGYIEQNMATHRRKQSHKENTMNFNKSSLKKQLEDSQQKINNKSILIDKQLKMMSDDKTKVMTCNICTKAFQTQRQLKIHIKTFHEVHKHYECESCGKSFAQAANLKRHIHTVHEGHKDYKCESCGKSFSRAQSLKKHIHTVHE